MKNYSLSVDGSFQLVPAQAGHTVDTDVFAATVLKSLRRDEASAVSIPVKPVEASASTLDPVRKVEQLEAQRKTVISYSYQGATKQPSNQEVLEWYVQSGDTYTLSPDAVKRYLTKTAHSLNVNAHNIAQLVQATQDALVANKATRLTFVPPPVIVATTFTYCTALRGVDVSYLNEFSTTLASAYSDARGWSSGDKVIFKRVDSGCNFTAWLAAADQVPTFSPGCDTVWSCTSGNNVKALCTNPPTISNNPRSKLYLRPLAK